MSNQIHLATTNHNGNISLIQHERLDRTGDTYSILIVKEVNHDEKEMMIWLKDSVKTLREAQLIFFEFIENVS